MDSSLVQPPFSVFKLALERCHGVFETVVNLQIHIKPGGFENFKHGGLWIEQFEMRRLPRAVSQALAERRVTFGGRIGAQQGKDMMQCP
jgi:hypothetical protein